MSMFHEILINVSWGAVLDALQRHYPEDAEKSTKGFQLVWDQLIRMEPTKQPDWTILADALEDEDQHDPEDLPAGEAPAHVHARQQGDDSRYSIGFTPWVEVLGMEVAKQSRYSDAEMVAHVLWEITWYGFEESTVQAFSADLSRRARELSNMTDEEREAATVSWDELRERLSLDRESD